MNWYDGDLIMSSMLNWAVFNMKLKLEGEGIAWLKLNIIINHISSIDLDLIPNPLSFDTSKS